MAHTPTPARPDAGVLPSAPALPSAPLELSAFQSAAASSFVPLRIETARDRRKQFRGMIHSKLISDIHLSDIRAGKHLVERRQCDIESSHGEFCKLSIQVSGRSAVAQGGAEIVLDPGDAVLYDTTRPYSIEFTTDYRCLVLMFPKDRLSMPWNWTEQVLVSPIRGEGAAAVLSTYLLSLFSHPTVLNGPEAEPLLDSALDMLGLLVRRELGQKAQHDPQAALLNRMLHFIEEHLGDPGLSPSLLAEAHYISLSRLHSLFRSTGSTVSQHIRSRRLETCRRELLDPRHSHESLALIASRWGFSDAAHFSRLYKEAFGLSPSQHRRAHSGL